MHAVVEVGGFQYLVEEGMRLQVPRLPQALNSTVQLKKILLLGNKDELLIGQPWVEKGVVEARILAHTRGPKLQGFKFRRRENYRRKLGHHQDFTQIEVTTIKVG
jgi:large subunit ribosomal protein L21